MTGQTGTWQAPPPTARPGLLRGAGRCAADPSAGWPTACLPGTGRPVPPRTASAAPPRTTGVRRTIHTDQEATTVGSYFEIAEPHPDEQHQPRRTNTHIVTVGQKDDYDLRTDRDAAEYRIVRAYSQR
jgi:hypothetical protein